MFLFILILSFLSSGNAAETNDAPTGEKAWQVYTEWPFNTAEAKRRQQETAKALGIPVKKTIDLGNGVTMEFILIPAGRFIMGTPEPVQPDWAALEWKIQKAQVILGMGVFAFMVMVTIMVVQSIRQKHRPQISLGAFMLMIFALSVCVLGGVRWHQGAEAKTTSRSLFDASVLRFQQAWDMEKPAHAVTLSKPFYMGMYEVTQEEYVQVMGMNRSQFKGRSLPVESVWWDEAVLFCGKVGRGVRLPSESEWEYACRAGSMMRYCNGDNEADLRRVGWHESNSGRKPHPVGTKESNAFGLYDMHGNAWELCQDDWHWTYEGAPSNGSAWIDSPRAENRVCRGGALDQTPESCRCASRGAGYPLLIFPGFRVLLDFCNGCSGAPDCE